MTARLEVAPGSGTVVRFGSVVAWMGPGASPSLVDFLVRGARAMASAPGGGRQLADQVAAVLRAGDPEPLAPFVLVGMGEGGWGALLHGPVQLFDGARWSAPVPDPGWLGVLLGQPPVIVVGAGGQAAGLAGSSSPYDLERGVVPGSGFTLYPAVPDPPAAPGPPAVQHADAQSPPAHSPTTQPGGLGRPPLPAPGARAVVAEPALAGPSPAGPDLPWSAPGAVLDLRQAAKPAEQAPLPPVGTPDARPAGTPVVSGISCPNGHFNHAAVPSCRQCRAPISDADRRPVSGPRPPLGVLVRDDGAVFGLSASFVLGTAPETDPTVTGGLALPLGLRGPGSERVSAAHAELRLAGWDLTVIDRGSAAGTFVMVPGDTSWSRLAPYQARTVAPGTHLACGPRVLTFISSWPR
ncbi:MAG: hypothetical protein ACRDY0_01590 [Acidimicrobiales bacterium]